MILYFSSNSNGPTQLNISRKIFVFYTCCDVVGHQAKPVLQLLDVSCVLIGYNLPFKDPKRINTTQNIGF